MPVAVEQELGRVLLPLELDSCVVVVDSRNEPGGQSDDQTTTTKTIAGFSVR